MPANHLLIPAHTRQDAQTSCSIPHTTPRKVKKTGPSLRPSVPHPQVGDLREVVDHVGAQNGADHDGSRGAKVGRAQRLEAARVSEQAGQNRAVHVLERRVVVVKKRQIRRCLGAGRGRPSQRLGRAEEGPRSANKSRALHYLNEERVVHAGVADVVAVSREQGGQHLHARHPLVRTSFVGVPPCREADVGAVPDVVVVVRQIARADLIEGGQPESSQPTSS